MPPTWVALTTERRRSLARPGSSFAELRFSVSKALVVRRSEAPPEIDVITLGLGPSVLKQHSCGLAAEPGPVDWLALTCECWRPSSPLSAEADPVFSAGPVGVQVSSFEK